jgi:AAA domain-containing protein/uncharacterized protein DUF4326/putative AbiEi antitoxin of type IV toxin-antitoxin system
VTAAVEETNLLAGLRDGAWLDAQTFPPLRWAVPGIIPEGFTLKVGPPKVGKSLLMLSGALAVASGGRMMGIPVGDPRPVLLLALEDGDRRLQDRCRMLLHGEAIPHRLQYLTRVPHGRVVDVIADWLQVYGDRAPLVVIDTLGKVMPPAVLGESSYGRDYRVGSTLKRAVDEYPGAALLVLHHDRKATSDDFVDAVSGTHGLAGAADTIVVLARERTEETGLLKVTGRDVIEGEYAVEFKDGIWSLVGGDLAAAAAGAVTVRATENLAEVSTSIVKLAAEHPGGIRASDVVAALGIADGNAKDYLARLARSGRLARLGRGLYGPPSTPVASVATVALMDVNATSDGGDTVTSGVRRGERVKMTKRGNSWSVPPGAVYVGRPARGVPKTRSPTEFGNPHRLKQPCRENECDGVVHDRDEAIKLYREYVRQRPWLIDRAREKLAGKDLACWCDLDVDCHADVLLDIAAGGEP